MVNDSIHVMLYSERLIRSSAVSVLFSRSLIILGELGSTVSYVSTAGSLLCVHVWPTRLQLS
jgi:hypothetical protein